MCCAPRVTLGLPEVSGGASPEPAHSHPSGTHTHQPDVVCASWCSPLSGVGLGCGLVCEDGVRVDHGDVICEDGARFVDCSVASSVRMVPAADCGMMSVKVIQRLSSFMDLRESVVSGPMCRDQ